MLCRDEGRHWEICLNGKLAIALVGFAVMGWAQEPWQTMQMPTAAEVAKVSKLGLENAVSWFVDYESIPDSWEAPEWAKKGRFRDVSPAAFRNVELLNVAAADRLTQDVPAGPGGLGERPVGHERHAAERRHPAHPRLARGVQGEAERAVDTLISAGWTSSAISVLMPDRQSSKEFAHEKNTKAPEGATTGVLSGGAVGGALGMLAGIGALAIPGVGPFIAAGPIMGALAGLGVGGAVGGLVGALVGMGIPEYEAKRYEGRLKKGGILLSVHCDTSEEINRAKEIMKNTHAEDISSTGESSADTETDRDVASKTAGTTR